LAEAYEKAIFLTPEELVAAKDYITANWKKVVYGK
jgi:hypothetical protein